jgi:hypothetical protein
LSRHRGTETTEIELFGDLPIEARTEIGETLIADPAIAVSCRPTFLEDVRTVDGAELGPTELAVIVIPPWPVWSPWTSCQRDAR